VPERAEVRLDTSVMSVDECVNRLIDYLLQRQLIFTPPQTTGA